ncbi:hypothetical protein [Archangium lipolyticum]|uniref:hypothetical protein n=1 Tax=Archangium lipolyticum TaxID=2970465 RepID=UPI0021499FA6|nr:hypothetical protein [Archangium lipolyticum]
MSASHQLEVSAIDESGSTLSLSSAKLKSATAMGLRKGSGSAFVIPLSGLSPGKHELCLSFADRPEFVFPLSLVKESTGLTPRFEGAPPVCCPRIEKSIDTSGGATKHVFNLTFRLAKSHSEVLLVAGWDFSGGANNIAYCESYRDDLYTGTTYRTGAKANITKRIGDATVVTTFDFKTGNRSRAMKGSSGWFEMDRVLQGTVKTHLGNYKTPANVQKRYLDNSISIKHVYDYIIELGSKAPGALKEFHIFSHAWAGGPILVETYEAPLYDDGGARAAQRDPNDKDPRLKDFDPINMPRLKEFKAAFASDAIAKVWGCMATTIYRNLIRAIALAKSDTEKISFDWVSGKETLPAGDAKKYLQQTIMRSTYMARLSAAVGGGLKVYGAPPGMGADLRSVPAGGKTHNYMYVNNFTYKREFDFLRKALGTVPDDTGYILF